uniref:Cytochrome b-c1 complex subunit 8 n=1 Tax=Ciona savignyi TaxID=51511 RepID=H2Z1U3_CIOSA
MRLSSIYKHGFGSLGVTVDKQIVYTMSAMEHNPIKGVVSKGFPNVIRRTKESFLVVAIPALLCYLSYDWGTKLQAKLDRKDPKMYENDV